MAVYTIETPGGRHLDIEAADEAAALAGAQDWHSKNSGQIEPAAPVEKPSIAADMGRSAWSGLVSGAAGVAGLPGTFRDFLDRGVHAAVNKTWDVTGYGPQQGSPEREQFDRTRIAISPVDPLVAAIFGDKSAETARRGVLGQPSVSDLQGIADNHVYGAKYETKTIPGAYVRTAAEFAPSLAAGGPGSRVARAAVDWLIPAIMSEAAGQLTAGKSVEPYARAAAGLGANLGGAAVRARSSAPERIVQNATSGMTPAQWTEAERVAALGAGPVGVPLSGPEAISQAAGGSKLTDVLRTVEGSTHGGSTTQQFFGQRPQQVEGAVGRTLDAVGPQDPRPSTLGPRAATAAQNVLDDTERGINAATRPAYQAAEAHVLDPADFAPIAADPAFQASLRRLRNDEVLGPTYAQAPDNSVSVIDAVTKDMRDRGVALGNAQNPGFSSQTAGIYGRGSAEARDIARDPARGGVQAYDDALTAQEQARHQNLDPLQQGPIGALARVGGGGAGTLGGTEAAGKALLPPAGTNAGGAPEIQDAVARLVMASAVNDPTLPASLIRQRLANAFDKSAAGPMTGQQEYAGAKFRNEVYGSPQQRENVKAAVGALPGGAPAVQSLDDAMTVLQATGQRKQIGSPTAFNTEVGREMREMPLALEAASHPLTVAKDRLQRLYLGANQNRLADLFVAPDSVQRIRAISERQLESPFTAALARSAAQLPLETRSR